MMLRRLWVATLVVFTVACSGTPPPPAPPPLVSGIDQTLLDKSVRPQDDFFRYVNAT